MTENNSSKLYVGMDPPQEAIAAMLAAPAVFIDSETTGLSPYRDKLALLQMHDRISGWTILQHGAFGSDWLKELFDPLQKRLFIGHNISMFDLQFFAEVWGAKIFNLEIFDTLIAESLISTSGRRDVSVSLRASVRRRVGLDLDKGIQHGAWHSVNLTEEQVRYAVQDVLALVDLYDAQIGKAAEQGCQSALRLEMEVAPVLAKMSWNGMHLPAENFFQYLNKQTDAAKVAEDMLKSTLGVLNFNSPKQVISAVRRMGIELESTNHNTLMDYVIVAEDGPKRDIVQALINYRAPKKRASMYSMDWYMDNCTAGKVHPLFWSVGADTLRMSSSKPNLQQVPKDARGMFGNTAGLSVVSVDYSQLEIRVAAALSRDEALLGVLSHDDVHTAIASQIFNCAPENVSGAQRKASKAASFTLLFGGSSRTLHDYARRMGGDMTQEQADTVFKRFFETFKGLALSRQKAQAACKDRNALVIKLPGGAKRVLFGQKLSPQVVLNTTVQGTAAIGLKHALAEAKRRGIADLLCACVHDEIVAEVPAPYAPAFAAELSDAMIAGMSNVVNVEVKVESKIDTHW